MKDITTSLESSLCPYLRLYYIQYVTQSPRFAWASNLPFLIWVEGSYYGNIT